MGDARDAYVERIKFEVMKLYIVGDTPFISHRWRERPKGLPYDVPMRTNPVRGYVGSLYWLDYNDKLAKEPFVMGYKSKEEEQKEYDRIQSLAKTARFGFPAVTLKSGTVDTAFRNGLIEKRARLLGAFHIPAEFAVIKGIPEIWVDRLRVSENSKPLIRYSAAFKDWSSELTVQYRPEMITPDEIVNLMNLCGTESGIGIWTPARGGTMGKFHVQRVTE